MSIPEQIRALEKLAQIDAELKELDDAADARALDARRTRSPASQSSTTSSRPTALALAAMDKTRGELIQDVRNMIQQLEHSREKLNRSRTERESNAAQRELEELRKLVRDREEEIGKLTADADAVAPADRGDRGRAQEARRTSSGRARATSTRSSARSRARRTAKQAERDAVVEAPAAAALSALRDDPLEAGYGHRADDRRDVQGLPHVPAAAALSPPAPRAAPRAVPVLQPHHLLRRLPPAAADAPARS